MNRHENIIDTHYTFSYSSQPEREDLSMTDEKEKDYHV